MIDSLSASVAGRRPAPGRLSISRITRRRPAPSPEPGAGDLAADRPAAAVDAVEHQLACPSGPPSRQSRIGCAQLLDGQADVEAEEGCPCTSSLRSPQSSCALSLQISTSRSGSSTTTAARRLPRIECR